MFSDQFSLLFLLSVLRIEKKKEGRWKIIKGFVMIITYKYYK